MINLSTGQPFALIQPNPGMNAMFKDGASGGGSAGQVDYPPYIKYFHAGLLAGDDDSPAYTQADMLNYVELSVAASAANPYTSVAAYDPDTDLGLVSTQLAALEAIVDAIDTGDISTYVTAAVTQAASLLPDSEIDAAVASFEARSLAAFQRQVGRATAGMFDIRAVMSTQFDMMIANMEQDRAIQVDDMDSRLRLLTAQERYQAKIQLVDQILRLLSAQVQGTSGLVSHQFDLSKLSIVAKQDEVLSQVGFDEKDVLWDLNLLAYGQNVLSAISGAATVARPLNEKERLIAAVTNAGAFGLQLGTTMGNPAAGFAGGIGLLALQLIGGV
jgi:hypothetical protein